MSNSSAATQTCSIEVTDDGIMIVSVTPRRKRNRTTLDDDDCRAIIRDVTTLIRDEQRLVLDLGALDFPGKIPHLVAKLWSHLKKREGHLRLCSPDQQVLDLLKIIRLTRLVDVHEDLDAALAAFRQTITVTCPDCQGSGKYVGLLVVEPCQACGGEGMINK